jgi:hypothetical protein
MASPHWGEGFSICSLSLSDDARVASESEILLLSRQIPLILRCTGVIHDICWTSRCTNRFCSVIRGRLFLIVRSGGGWENPAKRSVPWWGDNFPAGFNRERATRGAATPERIAILDIKTRVRYLHYVQLRASDQCELLSSAGPIPRPRGASTWRMALAVFIRGDRPSLTWAADKHSEWGWNRPALVAIYLPAESRDDGYIQKSGKECDKSTLEW